MIILRSRSLIIPNDEYNLGNDYDTNTATRVFQLDRVMEGIDLANLMFKLDLTYADGTSDTLALDSEVTDDKINLTWTVTKNQLHVPGTVVVQIRALNVDGNMKWTSYIGAFFVEASMFGSADYNGKLSEVEQFEVAIKSEKERVQNEKARQDAEAERVHAEAERKSAEEERKTAEAERKSAETVRYNAETARKSAETEREEWYNSAKTNFDAAIASGDKAEEIANSLETNVEANMKAAAASATAAAGSASAAAGSANEAKQYSQNWSALDQRVTKNAADIAATNNNLSNGSVVAYFSPMRDNEANMCKGYNKSTGNFIFNHRGATSKIKDYTFGDGSEGVIKRLSELASKSELPKYKDIPIDISTLTFNANAGGYICNLTIADLIGVFTTVLSVTIVKWSLLSTDTAVMMDHYGENLTIRQNDNTGKGNITVRFVYI